MIQACQSTATLKEILLETLVLAKANASSRVRERDLEALRRALEAGEGSAAIEQEILSLREIVRFEPVRDRER